MALAVLLLLCLVGALAPLLAPYPAGRLTSALSLELGGVLGASIAADGVFNTGGLASHGGQVCRHDGVRHVLADARHLHPDAGPCSEWSCGGVRPRPPPSSCVTAGKSYIARRR